MTDADKVVAALAWFIDHVGAGDRYCSGVPDDVFGALEAALPIAREMAEQIKHYHDACLSMEHFIGQTLAQALEEFPWYKDDQANFPGATEESGVCYGDHTAESLSLLAARRLREMAERERELVAALEKARQDNLTLQRERGRRFDEVERLSNRIDELTQENVWLKRLIADAPTAYERIASELALDRARAAGAEVTGHE